MSPQLPLLLLLHLVATALLLLQLQAQVCLNSSSLAYFGQNKWLEMCVLIFVALAACSAVIVPSKPVYCVLPTTQSTFVTSMRQALLH